MAHYIQVISCDLQSLKNISLHVDVKERTVLAVRFKSFPGPGFPRFGMVGLIGLEPMTPALSRRCSNQLSYRPVALRRGRVRLFLAFWAKEGVRDARAEVVEVNGFEPLTFCLQSRRSTN